MLAATRLPPSPAPRLLLLVPLALLLAATATQAAVSDFVTRSGAQLMLGGKPWQFLGANAYWLIDTAKNPDQHDVVDKFFSLCEEYKLRVVRTWGYNHKSPSGNGAYDEFEMKGLDYIIHSAGKHNVRLVLALANFWNAYRSPEDIFEMAGEDTNGKDILDFYRSPKVKQFLKDHYWNVLQRTNTYTGRKYRDEPAIMVWNPMNEPRCPGCTADGEQSDHQAFLAEMSEFLKAAAPNHLIGSGTEGYFIDGGNQKWNPGAGVACEGESFVGINSLPGFDVVNAHIYKRQMEYIPPSWRKPEFADLLHWLPHYLNAHLAEAASSGKPYIVEEFNVKAPEHTPAEQAQVFQLMCDVLIRQAEAKGPFAGAMFWNAALGDHSYDDGYNIYLDVPAAPPPLPPSEPAAPPAPEDTTVRKEIFENTEGLNDFRRGAKRAVCADEEAKTWLPEWDKEWAVQDAVARYQLDTLEARTAGKRVQDVLRETAQRLEDLHATA